MRSFIFGIFIVLFCQSSTYAQASSVSYGDWLLNSKANITETYTANNPNSLFGLFCLNDQCMFYLHQSVLCEVNKKYSLLMSSDTGSHAIEMRCTQVGQQLFWILEPFNSVLRAVQAGEFIGFAVALQSGMFATSRFKLNGAQTAIRQALAIAAGHGARKAIPKPESLVPAPPNANPKMKDSQI